MEHLTIATIDNDPTMAANSASKVASQQATKALIATVAGGGGAPPTTSASDLTSGTLADARLTGNVALLTATQIFTNKSISGLTNTFSNISADSLLDGTTNKAFLATERTKLAGIATGATVNSTDSSLRDRTTHTGVQAISTVTGLQTALNAKQNTLAFTTTGDGIATFDGTTLNIPQNIRYFDLAQYSGDGLTTGTKLAVAHLAGSVIDSGTIADARTSTNIPKKDGTNVFSGSNNFSGVFQANDVTFNNATVNGTINSLGTDWGYRNTVNGKIYNAGSVILGDTDTVVGSALLRMDSVNKGFLNARMTTTQRDSNIGSPVEGLEVYNLTTHRPNFYDGTTWQEASSLPSTVIEVTGTAQTLVVNRRYIANNSAQVVFTLPTTAAIGDVFTILGSGSGGWRVSQNSNQSIKQSANTTTTGTGGFITSGTRYDNVRIICIVANLTFVIQDNTGTIGLT